MIIRPLFFFFFFLEHLRAPFHSCMSDPLIAARSVAHFQNSGLSFSELALAEPT